MEGMRVPKQLRGEINKKGLQTSESLKSYRCHGVSDSGKSVPAPPPLPAAVWVPGCQQVTEGQNSRQRRAKFNPYHR